MLLQIGERRIAPDITVIDLEGKLTLGHESQRIETMIDEFSKSGQSRVILEMTGVTYLDSTGLGLVALCAGRLKESGGRLLAVVPEGNALELLKLTRVDQIVTVVPTLADALAIFTQAPPEE